MWCCGPARCCPIPVPQGGVEGETRPALPSMVQSFKQSSAPNPPRCFPASETSPCSCASPGSGEAGERNVWVFFSSVPMFLPSALCRVSSESTSPANPQRGVSIPLIAPEGTEEVLPRLSSAREGEEFPSSAACSAPALEAGCAHTR